MSMSFYESRRARRRRFWRVVLNVVVVFGGLAGAGLYAYLTGLDLAQDETRELKLEVASLDKTVKDLGQRNDGREKAAEIQRRQMKELEQRYQREVPVGNGKALYQMVQKQLSAGVAAERLKFLIGSAEIPRRCDNAPVTKRFIARTPFYEGAHDSVSFGNNTVTVTARGEPVITAEGKPQSWFEPAEEVTATFTALGGGKSEITGKLPLHGSVLSGGYEYSFTLIAGDRGFIKVTGDRCAYP